VVICPGSRSTPLAIAFAEQPAIRIWMHVDERSAAYFGLGMAKQLRQPVALLCTSGTAAANFLPAVVEAKLTHVPLLVLTADRPHELRDNGAPQSIDQNRLYGTYVKWFVEVALPEATNAALRYIRTIAVRAVALTQAIPAGPVHLNLPFREPLTPEPIPALPPPQVAQRDLVAWQGRPNNAPYVEVHNAPAGAPTATIIGHVMDMVQKATRGLIIVGPNDDPPLAEPLVRLAQRLGYPILADPLSQLRCGDHDHSMIISSYDAFLRSDSFIESAQPELVLRFGAMPTSKPVLLYLKRYAAYPLIVIDGHGGWEEPTQLASELIHTDPAALCQGLLTILEQSNENEGQLPASQEWITMWQDADRVTRQTLQAAIQDFSAPILASHLANDASASSTSRSGEVQGSILTSHLANADVTRADKSALGTINRPLPAPGQAGGKEEELFEGRVFTELANLVPDGTTLYVGNSMPVRDLDTFFWSSGRRVRMLGNRGTNGIDGVVSSALGASAGAGQNKPTILVLGDLSFFHDLNGLLAARLHRLNLTIVLINNDGGGIFSFLPQAAYPEHFEQLFGTPTGLDFSLAVQMYGGEYQRVGSWEQFRKRIRRGLDSGGLHVIEVPTERASNVKKHRQLWEVVGNALNKQDKGRMG
jgi:2-succinyl-5-enolpyruvyl-6-hydroxy-3-cyclohexene-1-carboxylate synthase